MGGDGPSSMSQKRVTHAHSNHTGVVNALTHSSSTKILAFYEKTKSIVGAMDAQSKY